MIVFFIQKCSLIIQSVTVWWPWCHRWLIGYQLAQNQPSSNFISFFFLNEFPLTLAYKNSDTEFMNPRAERTHAIRSNTIQWENGHKTRPNNERRDSTSDIHYRRQTYKICEYWAYFFFCFILLADCRWVSRSIIAVRSHSLVSHILAWIFFLNTRTDSHWRVHSHAHMRREAIVYDRRI